MGGGKENDKKIAKAIKTLIIQGEKNEIFYHSLCPFWFLHVSFWRRGIYTKAKWKQIFFYYYPKVDYLRIDNFIVNRGRCETTWFTTNYIGEKPVEFYVYSNNNGLIINKKSDRLNKFTFDIFGQFTASVNLGFGETHRFSADCNAIEIVIVTNFGNFTYNKDVV